MDAPQKAFKDNVKAIFDAMKEQTQDSKAGLVGFGSFNTLFHAEHAHVHQTLTDNQALFQAAANNLTTNGGREPSCETIIKVAEGTDDELELGFREENGFCMAILTDEISNHDEPEFNETRAIKALTDPSSNAANAKGVLFGIVPEGPVMESLQPLIKASGGYLFDSVDFIESPVSILVQLFTKCNVAVNGITAAPLTAVHQGPEEHEITIKAIREVNGEVVLDPGENITVQIVAGPHSGTANATVKTNQTGDAVYKYAGTGKLGVDVIRACLGEMCAKTVKVEWRDSTTPTPRSLVNIVLEVGPRRANLTVGETYKLTAKVYREDDDTNIEDENVWLNILCGPHKGASLNAKTNANGEAVFEVKGEGSGRDIFEACIFVDNNDTLLCGEIVSATWLGGPGLTLSPPEATQNTTQNINTTLKLTATLVGDSAAVSGKEVAFNILSGPHSDLIGSVKTSKYSTFLYHSNSMCISHHARCLAMDRFGGTS